MVQKVYLAGPDVLVRVIYVRRRNHLTFLIGGMKNSRNAETTVTRDRQIKYAGWMGLGQQEHYFNNLNIMHYVYHCS